MQSSLAVLYIFFLARVYTSAFDDGVNSGPSSELSTCPEIPTVDNAEVSTTSFKSKYIKGDSVTYNCQQGYIGRVIFVCDGHKWQNIRNAKCSRKRCELPEDIPNGRFFLVNGTEFVYGTTIKYICKTGYRMVSRVDNRTCLAEGWNNHLPQCEEIVCELKQINGSVAVAGLPQNNAPIKYGHKLQFYCFQKGMLLSGNKEVTCSNEGQWSSPFPICEEVTCKEGELQNVKIVYGSPGVSPPFKPRHSLNFECTNPGWTMTGQSSITCREDGTWSSPYPTCSGCGPPPHIEFADLTTLQKSYYGYGERVEYRCQQYYTIWSLYGQPFKTCAQGTWNGFVKCLKPCIVTIEDMDANNIKQYYGQKRKMYSQHGDQISFTCQSGKRPTNKVAFRQQCRDGVMHLPLCM
ncbi:complement factor H isoform X2 [Ictalurus furcatus]|uniref:complement factor H isoform X2 n=1 Tax=Ictalurus furcatus TaxID=66913 RepID=UPI00235048D6|nr:complement factor H isoform X2 [Ictalurus furcatus]